MKSKGNLSRIMSRLEIVIAAILFFVMIFSCGLYINIKMNGKISSLPSLPEKDKRNLLKAVASESVVLGDDDLIEPVFVGVKNGYEMICASPDDTARRTFEKNVYNSIFMLFSGKHEIKRFEINGEEANYIEMLKNSDSYMLISFFCDLPSDIFLPCISANYDIPVSNGEPFFLKNMFLLPDESDSLYAVCVSENNVITIMYPEESISFSKIISESYDVSDGYSYFEYADIDGIYPVMSSSFSAREYSVLSNAFLYGKDVQSSLVSKIFDVFGINSSLVKSFTSGDKTEINYIDENAEVIIRDDGSVVFTSTDGNGIYLEEFLGYFPESGENYSFNDIIFALKNVVNGLGFRNDNISYSIVSIEDNDNENLVNIYLKLFTDGILVNSGEYDALFSFSDDSLVKAELLLVSAKKLEESYLLLPQKYSVGRENKMGLVYCPVLTDTEEDTKKVMWAEFSSSESEADL